MRSHCLDSQRINAHRCVALSRSSPPLNLSDVRVIAANRWLMFTSRTSEIKHPTFCSSSEQILTPSAVQVSSRSPCYQNRVPELNWSGTLTWSTMSDTAVVSNFRAFSGFLAHEEILGRNTSSFLFLNYVSFIREKTATQRHSFMRTKGNYLLNIVWF